MFRRAKKFTAAILTLVMAFSLSSITFAAEDVQVQLNGENLTFSASAKPIYRNDRVYVPFRSIFEGLGADIQYIAESNTITATKNGTTLKFTIGSNEVSVTENGQSRIVPQDVSSFEENGNTYVPIRFAENLGCWVNWNDDTQTASIIDKNMALESLKGQFSIMDKAMAFNKKYSENAYKFSGTISFNASVTDKGTATPISAKGTITGISESDKANISMAIKMDTASLKKLVGSDADAEAQKILKALGDIKMDIIINMETGKYYIHCPLLTTVTGSGMDDSWYELDLNELLAQTGSSISLKSLMDAAKSGSFEKYLIESINMVTADSSIDAETYMTLINTYKEMFSDSSFKKDADGYTSNYTLTEGNNSIKMTTKVLEKDDAVTGFSFDMSTISDGVEVMSLNAKQLNDNVTMNFGINLPNFFTMSLDLDMKMQKTTNKAPSQPPSGSNIVSINDLM